ncbi:type I toxin-antitoxin system SymE family toxin [Tahibacter soli]|uniref:Type I toxin-antitoxin system SymE family toxin n=1 Tax=Tahibacter soli TaxID=2983605 RepID=A0A9X3YHP4_9GAMM|nr:type I toxin-antitoxin system SymE family toxin [Tahibacter soli]MDC8011822.1 type I toxin-antitoxin system SymE family toxin [Tahibacter soli]
MAKPKPTAAHPIRMSLHVSALYYPPLAHKPYADARYVPYIRLRGHWLAAAGFSPADTLDVVVTPGKIVITRV